jgi:cell filamentation protein
VSRVAGPDPYLDPASGSLRNVLGITDPRELAQVEAALSASRLIDLHLESYGADIFSRLAAADRLRGLAREQFIGRLAEFLADVNALHPFREGNGRAQRAFFSQLAHDAGHHIDWVRIDPARNVAASAAAHRGDLASLTAMLNDLVDLPHPPRLPGPGGGRAA